MAAGTLAIDSRLQPDGADRYHPRPQVVYLDPMFPHKQKSALVKKEMRVFQSLVGPDLDADGLLAPARQLATKARGGETPGLCAAAGGRGNGQCGGYQRAPV